VSPSCRVEVSHVRKMAVCTKEGERNKLWMVEVAS
jgi:hypothetical protein